MDIRSILTKIETLVEGAPEIKVMTLQQFVDDTAPESIEEDTLDTEDEGSEYQVYQAELQDPFEWLSQPLYSSDNLAAAHNVAWSLWKKHPENLYMIWQERSQGSRGGYGPAGSVYGPEDDVDPDLSPDRVLHEAKLGGVSSRKFPDSELDPYLDRIVGKEKDKLDKYKRPYIHSGNIPIVNQDGQKYDKDALKQNIMTRPAKILKQNEKMQHSDGTSSIFYNIGLPALKGLAVDEDTGEFIVIDTCPGAGVCKTYCFAMKGSYVQWKATSMSQSRMLNFLYNDPEGFMAQLATEVADAEKKFGKKGTKVIIRWHDAGDFFSPQYLKMAYDLAEKFPNVDFYAYTKLADVAQGAKPSNFKMNFSMGALPSQEKKIDFHKTKHSKVVPKELFQDLIARDGKTLHRDEKGRMKFNNPQDAATFKQRLAAKYSIDPKSIISYDDMMKTKDSGKPQWNVVVMPGDGDDSANRHDVLGTYLVIH